MAFEKTQQIVFQEKREISTRQEEKNQLKTLDFVLDLGSNFYEKREKMIFEKKEIAYGH